MRRQQKLAKGAKRKTFDLEENTGSSNLVFSTGAWFRTVMPAVRYWIEVQNNKACKVGDYVIKIGGIKAGKENGNNHIDTTYFG